MRMIRVENHLPTVGVELLVFGPDGYSLAFYDGSDFISEFDFILAITHWAYLVDIELD